MRRTPLRPVKNDRGEMVPVGVVVKRVMKKLEEEIKRNGGLVDRAGNRKGGRPNEQGAFSPEPLPDHYPSPYTVGN